MMVMQNVRTAIVECSEILDELEYHSCGKATQETGDCAKPKHIMTETSSIIYHHNHI